MKQDGERIAVALDGSLGQFKIRPANLKHAEASTSISTDDTKTASPIDPTLFVAEDGQFVQPRVAAASNVDLELQLASEADGSNIHHQVALPSGFWEVILLEIESSKITVHLRATRPPQGETALKPYEEAWHKLEGLTCTRTVVVPEGADHSYSDAKAEIEHGILSIRVPALMGPSEEPLRAKVAAEVEHGLDVPCPDAESVEEVEDMKNSNAVEDERSPHEGRVYEWESVEFDSIKDRRQRRPASCGHPVKRSRQAAQAKRRAKSACMERRKAAHNIQRFEPMWKTVRAIHAAQTAM